MKKEWYSVSCLFHHPTRKELGENYLYEERITLWEAHSLKEAYVKASDEATQYAQEANAVFVQPLSSFRLFDESIVNGTEVYSLMRGSNFEPKFYRDTFCITDRDRLTIFSFDDAMDEMKEGTSENLGGKGKWGTESDSASPNV